MYVRDVMSRDVVVVGPWHTLRQVAKMMSARRVGSAVIDDPDVDGVGIITERDLLNALGADLDPDVEHADAHITWDVVYAGPSWTLEDAALAMARGGFRHLVVLDGDDVLGVVSVRDIMRAWANQRAGSTTSA